MKTIFLCIFVLTGWQAFSQSIYGTPLVRGSVTLSTDVTTEEYCNDILLTKNSKKEHYSTNLTGVVFWDNSTVKMLKNYPSPKGIQGTMLKMDNFIQTLPEGATFLDGKDYDVPQFPVLAEYEKKGFGKDPCKSDPECKPGFETVLNYKEKCSGTASHHGSPGASFRCSIVGVDKCSRYLFLSFNSSGTWVKGGKMENSFIHGKYSKLLPKIEEDGCKWVWEDGESKQMMAVDIQPAGMSVNDPEQGDATWKGNDGSYTRFETTDEGDGVMLKVQEEMLLMKIDTGTLFRYLREKPAMQSFSAAGSYNSTTDDGYRKVITREQYSATLTIGKKATFTIIAEDEESFKNWLPGHPDYPGSGKLLNIKAKFEEGSQQKDTIHFSIYQNSHLPGICTNYPILPEKPPREPSDIYFAPQDQQTDANIKILDDTTAVTTKLVAEAVVVVLSRDFGAHARINARASNSGEVAECPYDNKESIAIPYDMNGNNIADKWEKDMGIEGADKLEDIDELPKGHGREGDGLTVFEEYRGFICEKDLEASCDGGHTQRNGEHVRTSPLARDVFIFDPDGLFSNYVAPTNPAECHWHYVNREQMKIPAQDQVSQVIKANENDRPDEKDKSTGANAIRTELDAANKTMNSWVEKEYRRINANSPEKYRVNPQFGLHLLTSPHSTTEGGVTICPDPKASQSPLRYTHLVVLPQFEAFKKRQMGVLSGLLATSIHPELKAMYPMDVQEKVVLTAYEGMVPHEVGHGLGMNHHSKGILTVISTKTKEKIILGSKNNGSGLEESKGQLNELYYKDQKEYLITSANFTFMSLGVTECCMRYTLEREVDFLDKKVLLPSIKYCRKGQKFENGNGKQTDADDCFSQILIKCIN